MTMENVETSKPAECSLCENPAVEEIRGIKLCALHAADDEDRAAVSDEIGK